jgi:hypothetical protein
MFFKYSEPLKQLAIWSAYLVKFLSVDGFIFFLKLKIRVALSNRVRSVWTFKGRKSDRIDALLKIQVLKFLFLHDGCTKSKVPNHHRLFRSSKGCLLLGPLRRTRKLCIHKSILFLFKGLRWFSKRDMCVREIFWWSVSDLAYYISSLLIKHNRIFLIIYLPGKFSHFQQKMFWHLCIEIQFACFKIPKCFGGSTQRTIWNLFTQEIVFGFCCQEETFFWSCLVGIRLYFLTNL